MARHHVRINGEDRRVLFDEWLLDHDPAKDVFMVNKLGLLRMRGAGAVNDQQFEWHLRWLRASCKARCRRAGIELPR